jgi:hypothetical protein
MRKRTVTSWFVLLPVAFIASVTAFAHGKHGSNTPAGAWMLEIAPQPSPGVETPPPFHAVTTFAAGGTLSETNTALHPHANVVIFPDLGPVSASDGLGGWEAAGDSGFRAKFVKVLFSASGEHLGYIITVLDISVEDDTLNAKGESRFVLGAEPNAAPYFTGKVLARGTPLAAHAD